MKFQQRLEALRADHEAFISQKNNIDHSFYNGIYSRYEHPAITAEHIPLEWRYDLNPDTNPFLMERIGVNAAFNAGAIKWNGKYLVVVRVEGNDRKSFFAIAESPNGVDNFRFWDEPIALPKAETLETNVYDMRLIPHEDGWIYGIYCAERKDPNAPEQDTSSAVAAAGIVRTKDLKSWERLPDLISHSGQQRNVVLHPEFIDGKYALYTRPQDGFIDTGSGGGIGFGLIESMMHPEVFEENIIEPKVYHTIKEVKNGQGPAPIKTKQGWLHLAHGVRNTAAGLRYVVYMFMTDLQHPDKVTHRPAGHFIAPRNEERVGDVSNVIFSNGWIADEDGKVFIYYASSDTRLHIATTDIDRLVDYCMNTPEDKLTSADSVNSILELIHQNKAYLAK